MARNLLPQHLSRWVRLGLIATFACAALAAHTSPGMAAEPERARAQSIPAQLPVFQILPANVPPAGTSVLARGFESIGVPPLISDTSLLNALRYTAANTDTGSVLQQYSRSGGFFAFNATNAFTEMPYSLRITNEQICNYLSNGLLLPASETSPTTRDCGSNPTNYLVKPITLGTFNTNTGQTQTTQIGQLVQIPLEIDVGAVVPLYIPLGGPGGHLSLLFTGDSSVKPLDDDLPGLQALAAPWYGHQRGRQPLGTYPVVSPQRASRQLQSLFATAIVTPGTPDLVYYVDHPAAEQGALMPKWVFNNATANLNGDEISLKGIALDGVEGYSPDVVITAPADNTPYLPGVPFVLTATISGPFGPFSYTVEGPDGSTLGSGITPGGTVVISLPSLPMDDRGATSLLLRATNAYSSEGSDVLFIGQTSKAILPIVAKDTNINANVFAQQATLQPTAVNITRKMAAEWVESYPIPNDNLSNLGLTKEDADGFINSLSAIGWTKLFNYGNSSAWEKDWRDCSLGGIDCSVGIDRAQFAYFSGHGGPAKFYFGSLKDSLTAYGSNARFHTLRWASFSSCQTLRAGPYVGPGDPPLTAWFNSFQGSYMLLGFHSNMSDAAFGGPFANNMGGIWTVFGFSSLRPSIRAAWVLTAFQLNAGKPAYLYAVGNFNPVNYKLPLVTTSDPLTPLTGIYEFRWVWWSE